MITPLILLGIALYITEQTFKTCYDHKGELEFKKKFLSSKKFNEDKIDKTGVPKEFDWRKTHIISSIKNQHLPVWCGSCWAHAAASTMTDRFYIKKGDEYFDPFYISVEEIISCSDAGTCARGGITSQVYKYASEQALSDDTCNPYTAIDKSCTSLSHCSTCNQEDKCYMISDYNKYKISGFDFIEDTGDMMYQISKFGPISCSMYVSDRFLYNYTGGIYMEESDESQNHAISLVGYGSEVDKDGTEIPYWIGRNSWGTFWGEKGFFKIPRSTYKGGKFTLGIEDHCSYPII